jgi:RIO kinase 1
MKVEEAIRYVESRITPNKRQEDREYRKTYSEVFDNATIMTIYDLMSKGYIDIVDFPISTGKEGNVFRGYDRKGNMIAIKIYRVATSNFRRMALYIQGDPRFKGITKDHRKLVYTWARKEYNNLERLMGAGIRVPMPIAHKNNVLVMEYIGREERPAQLLKDADFKPEKAYEFIVDAMGKAYNQAKLVHGDISEYNILVNGDEFVLIDAAQAVHLKHPSAEELLRRDARNVARYFGKLGIDTDEGRILKEVRG